MQKEETKAFVKSYPDYVEELYTECSVYNYRGQKADYIAFWDTGASNTLITKRVVEDLKLAVSEFAELYHAGGSNISNCYNVFIELPNNILIGPLKVIEGQIEGSDVLIGMDIIGSGDLVVTNNDEHTEMAFSIPSSLKVNEVLKKS